MEMPMIEARELAKTFDHRAVLEKISFSVEAGEVFGLLGPNGAGKTTTLRLFLGLLRPGAGEALVFGAPLADRPDLRRRVGVLLEQSGMSDRLTARENLAFYGALHGVGHEVIDDRLAQAGLLERAEDRVGTFSTGMKRRLGLVRATLHDPEVLFLDEPSSGLDPAAQAEIRDLITRLARQSGAAVLINSHHLDEVERICDRVAILDKGRLAALGEVEALRRGTGPRRYRDPARRRHGSHAGRARARGRRRDRDRAGGRRDSCSRSRPASRRPRCSEPSSRPASGSRRRGTGPARSRRSTSRPWGGRPREPGPGRGPARTPRARPRPRGRRFRHARGPDRRWNADLHGARHGPGTGGPLPPGARARDLPRVPLRPAGVPPREAGRDDRDRARVAAHPPVALGRQGRSGARERPRSSRSSASAAPSPRPRWLRTCRSRSRRSSRSISSFSSRW